MFKTCTTFYREGATHTVVLDQEIRQFKTAPRIIFWLTTADDQTDEQIRDRLLRIDTTEDPKHTKEVIDFIFRQRKSGAASFDPREIEVCQAIIHLLKQVFVDVVIPFSDNIRFEGDPRGATIFADLVSAFAVWRYRLREHDGTGAVIACYEDYKNTETFFNAIKGHGDTKYTPRELRVLQAIKDLHGEATREMVMTKTGLSKGDLSDILNGRSRDGQAKYGLFHKCAALTEDEEGTSIQIEDIKKTRTSIKKKILRLPKDYDTLSAYGKAVYLADETTIKRTCSAGSEQFGTGSEIKNEFGKDVVRKFVEYNIIRERRTNEPKHKLSPVDEEKIFSFSPGSKNTELPNLEPLDTGLPLRTNANSTELAEPYPPEHLDEVLVCRQIKKAIAAGITDPVKLAEAVGIPVCTLARHAGNYPGIDLQAAGSILVQLNRASWWRPPSQIEAALHQAEAERQVKEQHFRTPTTLKAIYKSKGEALEYADFSLNLYSGCSHQCTYCYNSGKFRSPCTEIIKKASLENIEHDLNQLAALENKTPVHLSFVGDPFDLGRSDNSYTHRVLELFKKYQHPFQILTKGGMKAIQEPDLYFEGCSMGCTLTFDNPEDSKKWEPGAALPGDRIAALELAHKKGIKTWVSLEPVIDPIQSLHLIDMTQEFVDHYGVGKLNHNAALENAIDWPKFRADAEAKLQRAGKSYKIKPSLQKAAQGDGPDPEEPAKVPAQVDTSEKIRVAAIIEYGINGWVDPRKISFSLKLPLEEIEAWLQTNYIAYERTGGGIGYRQRRAGEAPA
jgi:DNA repair photolyase